MTKQERAELQKHLDVLRRGLLFSYQVEGMWVAIEAMQAMVGEPLEIVITSAQQARAKKRAAEG